ncbi:MAG: Ser-Thr-rich GPI-anchored membrane family protein [Cyclobacteriaceae bacterium]
MPKYRPNARILAAFALLLGASAYSQEITIKRIELEHEKVYLHYSLQDTTVNRYYTINLYTSRDNFLNPVQKIKGDVGIEVPPGNNRKIEVNVRDEFGPDFEGKLAFELRAKVYIPFIRITSFTEYKKFKRGKPYEIQWSGGRPQNVLNFDLFKGDQKVHTFPGIPNGGKYTMLFPMNTKPGDDYRFRISDSKNKDEVVNFGTFSIRRKVPLLFKVLPAAAIGGVSYILLQPEEECADCLPEFLLPN